MPIRLKKKNNKSKLLLLILICLLIVSTGFRCKWVSPKVKKYLEPIQLTYWRVWDERDAFSEIISAYQSIHPNISINYRKLRYEEYEKLLLEAWAEDRGPDIFSLHNTWLRKYQSKITPLPSEITLAYQIKRKTWGIKEETISELRTNSTPSLRELKNNFLDLVIDDIVIDNKVYGLPLSVDTLVLFYNRDLLNNAGIIFPPTNWREFQEAVRKMTFQDRIGKIIQSGAAIGIADNITRGTDILSLLMMQNGAQMSSDGQITFHLIPPNQLDKTYNPGPEALRFYTDFASPSKEVYSWNKDMPDSLDAFSQGKVGLFFGYSYHIPYIEAKSQGKLNYSITKVPQIEDNVEINFANYWLEVISKKSKYPNEAWDFILFATQAEQVQKYLNKTKKPTALRTLISKQLEEEKLNAFASQLLTAKSWYRGKDANATEEILKEMINQVLEGRPPQEAINLAVGRIQQTY